MKMRLLQILTLLFSVLIAGISCSREENLNPPDPDPEEVEIEIIIDDYDGNGILSGGWSSSNDESDMTTYEYTVDPDEDQTDSVLHMKGSDTDSDWWIGTSLGGSATGDPFGLPEDASSIRIAFDLYAGNSTTNLEIQLQEADGDVFSWNLGSDGGYSATAGTWTSYETSTLDEFPIGYQADGDNVIAPELLANVSLALISGGSVGKSADMYLDNIRFVIVEVTNVASPTNLSAVAMSNKQIDLYWTDNADNETGFVIERQEDGDSVFEVIDTVDADIDTYSDSTLSASTTYIYRVYAIWGSKESNYTNTAEATTEANATITTILTTFDGDGVGLLADSWTTSYSDNSELADYTIVVNPLDPTSTDSVLYMGGTDTDADWWIGTAVGGDRQYGSDFGLPEEASKTILSFQIYAGTSTSNVEIQLQEADGDVFSWNLGSNGGYSPSQEQWVTYTVALSDFSLASWNNGGTLDNVFAPELLSNVSFALISGMAVGNESKIYINNVKFIVSE